MDSSLKCHTLTELNTVPGQFCAISRTKRTNGFFRIGRFVHICSLRILFSTPHQRRWLGGLQQPCSEFFVFRAALVACCLRGAFPPVDFETSSLVRAIVAMLDQEVLMIVQKKF